MPGQIVHLEIPPTTPRSRAKFWGSMFGWEFESFPGPSEYHMTQISDGMGAQSRTPEPGKLGTRVYFDVDDIGEGIGRVQELGGEAGGGATSSEHGLVRRLQGPARQRVRPLADRCVRAGHGRVALQRARSMTVWWAGAGGCCPPRAGRPSGRGVERIAGGSSRSSPSADRPAASDAPAAATNAAVGETASGCVPGSARGQAEPPRQSHRRHVAAAQRRRCEVGDERHQHRRVETLADADHDDRHQQHAVGGLEPDVVRADDEGRTRAANIVAAIAIVIARRWPSASLAIRICASTTVNAFANSSRPIRRELAPI